MLSKSELAFPIKQLAGRYSGQRLNGKVVKLNLYATNP